MINNPTCIRLLLISSVLLAGITSAATPLSSPFVLSSTNQPEKNSVCRDAPPPIIKLSITSKYGDDGPQRDTLDAAAEAEETSQMAPLRSYSQAVVKMANAYIRTGDPAPARCALTWLSAWAGAGALAQMDDHNAQFQRAAVLAGLSLAMLQIRPAVSADPRYGAVALWMRRSIAATMANFDATSSLKGSRNNHLYWVGLAAASVAVVNNDRTMLTWAASTYQQAVCGANSAGGLPLELSRGAMARNYHLFALNALVPLAVLLQGNGIDAFAECDGALGRIVNFSLVAIDDPAAITALAGKAQHPLPGGVPGATQVAFIEAYQRYAQGPIPQLARLLALRPLTSTNLGGDQTLLYGRQTTR